MTPQHEGPSTDPSAGLSRRRLFQMGGALAAGSIATPLISSCGTASASEPLRFWNFYSPITQEKQDLQRQSDWFAKLVKDWNSTHERQVVLEYIPGQAYSGSKLPTAFAAGSGPDIFLISPGDFLRYQTGGVLADLTPYMTKEAIDDFFPDALATRTVDGKVYALPMEIEPLTIFYSRPAWEKAGLSEGDIPTNWDQLLNVADKLTSASSSGLVLETNPGYYQNFTYYPWFWAANGQMFNADQTAATFAGAAGEQSLRFWADTIRTGVAPRTLPAAGDLVGALSGGQAAMWHSGIWNVVAFQLNAPDFDYGVFKTPWPSGGEYTTALGGWAFVANAKSHDAQAAAEFCVYALGSMEDHSIDRMVDWCTYAKSDIAPRKSALERGTAKGGYDSPVMKAFKDDIFPGGRGEPRYPPVVYKAISDAVQACQLAGADPARAAETANQAIDAYLKTYDGPRME